MSNLAKQGFYRASNILLADKKRITDDIFNDVIKSDIVSVLNNYFELDERDCELDIQCEIDGKVRINLSLCANRSRDFWKV